MVCDQSQEMHFDKGLASMLDHIQMKEIVFIRAKLPIRPKLNISSFYCVKWQGVFLLLLPSPHLPAPWMGCWFITGLSLALKICQMNETCLVRNFLLMPSNIDVSSENQNLQRK